MGVEKIIFAEILYVLIIVALTVGDECIPVKKVHPLIESILNKQKGMDVTLDKKDLEDLFRLKYGCADESKKRESVYFSATLTPSYTTTKSRHLIKFNKVYVNKGNAYDPSTGTFTCPVSGTYQFSFSFTNSDSNKRVLGRVVVNGNDSFLYALALEDYALNTGVGTVLYPFKKGDRVQVIINERGATIYGYPGYSTFSGMLISEE